MSQAEDERLERSVAQRMAPAIALRHLPDLHAEWEWVLRPFLRELPSRGDGSNPLLSLEVKVTADSARYGIRAAGASSRMIDGMAEFFGEIGADPDALDRLSEFGAAVDPLALGMWLEVASGTGNFGWWLPESDIEDLPLILDNPDQANTIRAWADAAGVGNFMAAGRTVAKGDPVAFVSLPLPGDDAHTRLGHAITLLNEFGVEGPANEALAVLMDDAIPLLEVGIWLLPTDVSRAIVRANQPSLRIALDFARTQKTSDVDLLAQLQGILQQQEVAAIESVSRAEGDEIAFAWELMEG